MKTQSKWIAKAAAAAALALTLGAPAFAQSRGDWNRNDSYRESSFARERDMYRVRGVVTRIDYRNGTMFVRDTRSGRLFATPLTNRRVRRGELVEIRVR